MLEINPGLIFWTIVTFIVVLIVLSRVAWKPLVLALTSREEQIRTSLEQAESANAEARKLLEENKRQLAQAEAHAQQAMREGRELGEKLKAEIIDKANANARTIAEQAKEEIRRERDAALMQLRSEVADLAVAAAGKIIDANLDVNKHRQLVDAVIKDIPAKLITMKNTRVARRYAQALMMTANSPKAIDEIANDVGSIKAILDESRELRRFISSPVIRQGKKLAVLRELFQSRVTPITMSFLQLLVEKQREAALLEVIDQFLALRDTQYGIVNIDVASAVEISPEQGKSLSQKLEQFTKKKVRVRFALDKALKGGLVVKIGDTVLDASVRRQLELLREQFVHGHALN